MPPAARIADFHTCPMVNPGPVPHVGGPVASGSPDVIIGFMPAARKTDTAICVPAVDAIQKGSTGVLINNLDAARIGDPTNHGGVIVMGCPTVIIGEKAQAVALQAAAKNGSPFCEECEKAKAAEEEAKREAQAGPAQAAPVEVPPPDAPVPADAQQAPEPPRAPSTRELLAASPNLGDALDAARGLAREALAREFLGKHAGLLDTAADIDALLRCIDLELPVKILGLPLDAEAPGLVDLIAELPLPDASAPVQVLASHAAELAGVVAAGAPQLMVPPSLGGGSAIALVSGAPPPRARSRGTI